MSYIQGEGRSQGTLFPVVLDDLVPEDHVCRVIDAFVVGLSMHARATPALMRLRRSTVEHPFGTLKYRIFGHPRFLLRGLTGAHTEISLAITAYNLKRMITISSVASD
jgi:hypothetical protein